MEKTLLFAKVADGIWIGNAALSRDEMFFRVNDISAVIKLDRAVTTEVDADEFTFAIPDDELMEMEYAKVISKLKEICDTIKELRDNRRNIVIQCADGKNKSSLVAGYYLSRRGGINAEKVIDFLTCVYFNPDQVKEEQCDKERLQKIQNGVSVPDPTPADLKKQEERRNLRALSNRSFCGIIRSGK